MQLIEPMGGCKVVLADGRTLLFGQPPEVIKSLAAHDIHRLDVLVLPDTRERDGVLLNNLEFPLYHFLFIANGLREGRRLGLIGDRCQVQQVLQHLRLTLLGPNREELEAWGTEPELREEWLNAGRFFALKDADGAVLEVASFFDVHYLDDGPACIDGITIEHRGPDSYAVRHGEACLQVALDDGQRVVPPYPVHPDQVPGNLVNFGLDILGGASGFTPHEASTGMVICHHGNYILVDCIPFLDQHLEARGIAKSQIRTLLLTHLHDDHCNMFPLMLSAHRVEVITTREIFEMAITKLALGLGWQREVVADAFELVEVRPGQPLRYFGLEIDAHVTVHSIPTIGVTVRTTHMGREYRACIVGDNQSFGEIADMRSAGLLRESTEANLHRLYREPFDLLIADGGMGVIHGDPADALDSGAEQVVFVHVDRLPEQFTSTFSLANAGKRYVIVDGQSDLYTARALELFSANFDVAVPRRWLSALLGDKRILRFNRDDVILKQGSASRGSVFLVLTGRCEVLVHDGQRSHHVGTREAGDFIGEMATVTGVHARNASVIARTPVTACEFSEETFMGFVSAQGLAETLRQRWTLREQLAAMPVLQGLGTTVIEQLSRMATVSVLDDGAICEAVPGHWYLLVQGQAVRLDNDGEVVARSAGAEGGELPLDGPSWQAIRGQGGRCLLACIPTASVVALLQRSPRFSYRLRAYRERSGGRHPWLLRHCQGDTDGAEERT